MKKNNKMLNYTHQKWKLYTFIIGFTMHENKTHEPPNAEIGI